MSGLSTLYKDTLKRWDTITDISLDTKEFTEANITPILQKSSKRIFIF